MNALVITHNHTPYSFFFIQICYPNKGLTALSRKRSIFITIWFYCQVKNFKYVN